MENLTDKFQEITDADKDGGAGFTTQKKTTSDFFKTELPNEVVKKTTETIKEKTSEISDEFPIKKDTEPADVTDGMTDEEMKQLAEIYARMDIESVDLGFSSAAQLIFFKQDKNEITKEFSLDNQKKENLVLLLKRVYILKKAKKNPVAQFWKAIGFAYLPLVIGLIRRLIYPPKSENKATDNIENERIKRENQFLKNKVLQMETHFNNIKTVNFTEIPKEVELPQTPEEIALEKEILTDFQKIDKGTAKVYTQGTAQNAKGKRGRKSGQKAGMKFDKNSGQLIKK